MKEAVKRSYKYDRIWIRSFVRFAITGNVIQLKCDPVDLFVAEKNFVSDPVNVAISAVRRKTLSRIVNCD